MKKKFSLIAMAGAALLLVAACGTTAVTSSSTNLWDQIVYGFAQVIRFLSFGGLTGVGIFIHNYYSGGIAPVDEYPNQI